MPTSSLCLIQGHVDLLVGVSCLGNLTENGKKQIYCWPWWTDGSEVIAAPETGVVAWDPNCTKGQLQITTNAAANKLRRVFSLLAANSILEVMSNFFSPAVIHFKVARKKNIYGLSKFRGKLAGYLDNCTVKPHNKDI